MLPKTFPSYLGLEQLSFKKSAANSAIKRIERLNLQANYAQWKPRSVKKLFVVAETKKSPPKREAIIHYKTQYIVPSNAVSED